MITSAVQRSNRDLYLVRNTGEVAQLVGIGLADSEEGDLASEAALRISHVLSPTESDHRV